MKKLLILILIAIIVCSGINPSEENEENKSNNHFREIPQWVLSESNSNDYFPRLMTWLKENNIYEKILETVEDDDFDDCCKFLAIDPCRKLFENLKKYPNF